ncbi:MAG: hypothetical protein FWF51_02375 [Chitinivibrionia bacterium]|nr:hypothetical protein [Chitinivibrionia bacterium]MCL1945985.1 hypothetical protein [Chitinivibrionia bacterium]
MRLIKNNFLDNENYERMPVLFCIFTKTETSVKVFNAIKKSKPKKLYISSDCWRERKIGEKENVENLRKYVLENIDWDCEVHKKFNEKNHGSGRAMESAIDWFFENEEMGIILEDDTLPAPSFFRFCSDLLIKYKDEEKVFLINGINEGAQKTTANTYSFKRVYDFPEDVNGFWGWASWRRAWKKHDKKMLKLQEYKKQCKIDENTLDYDKYLKNTRIRILVNQVELILAGENNCWDLKFKFSSLINNGLFIIPDCNLVTNIGAGVSDAAHTAFEYAVGTTLVTGEIRFPLEHQAQISPKVLTPKEYLRAAYMPISAEKEFWDMETEYTDSILDAHNFLATSGLPQEQKLELYRNFLCKVLYELITVCTLFKEFGKAQKYLYLSLAKSLLRGENNICSKCQKRECLSVCPTNSISSQKAENGEIVIKIDRKTCEYCFNCVKTCNVVKQR